MYSKIEHAHPYEVLVMMIQVQIIRTISYQFSHQFLDASAGQLPFGSTTGA